MRKNYSEFGRKFEFRSWLSYYNCKLDVNKVTTNQIVCNSIFIIYSKKGTWIVHEQLLTWKITFVENSRKLNQVILILRTEFKGSMEPNNFKMLFSIKNQKFMMLYASCTFGWPKNPSSTWNIDTAGYYWKRLLGNNQPCQYFM